MKTGIVILNYNSYDVTKKLVEHCLNMECINKIILIDNNSKDSFDFYDENEKICYIKNEENNGYASGNNIGIKYLFEHNYDVGFIANPDVWFEKSVIEELIDFFKENTNYGVCSCKRTGYNGSPTRQFWWIPTKKQAILESLHFMRSYYTKLHQKKSYEICQINNQKKYIDVEVVGGAFFAFDVKIMNEVNYLDENTFLWYEENILATKLKKNGYKEAILLNVEYQHNHIHHGHGNGKIKTYLNSKRHFCYNYLNFNIFEKIIMRLFEIVGIIEEKIICLFFN